MLATCVAIDDFMFADVVLLDKDVQIVDLSSEHTPPCDRSMSSGYALMTEIKSDHGSCRLTSETRLIVKLGTI